ncbi:MAG: hypothetical protein K1X79_12560 [Oligoflexia bacterium]|nr:hypothetical protein [Oligoflexia bacterium]
MSDEKEETKIIEKDEEISPPRSDDAFAALAKKDSAHSDWDYARAYAGMLGNPHRLFTNCVRYLRELRDKTDNAPLSSTQASRYPINTLIHSPSFKSVIYYAAAALHPKELKALKALTPGTLLTVFTPDELSAIVAITYVYRRVKKLVPPTVWEGVSGEVHIQMETGFHVGNNLPAIGTSRGIMVGALRYITLSLFSKRDARGYKLYKRHLNEKELLFDIQDELQRWKCNHLQIASSILQGIGLGIGAASGLVAPDLPTHAKNERQLKDAQAWFATRTWIQSLLENECAPKELAGQKNFEMSAEKLADVQKQVESIYENGSTFDWIDKTKADLPSNLNEALTLPEPLDEHGNPVKEEMPADII